MGKIVVSTNMTLDGVVQDPDGGEGFERGGWFTRTGGQDLEQWAGLMAEEAQSATALLLGRRSDEWFASRWSSRDGAWADRLNGLPKYVVSATLDASRWTNATLVTGDAVVEEAKLRREVEGEILVYASYPLVRALLDQGLVDEPRPTVFPVVLGAGERLFGESDGERTMRLRDNRTLGEGLTYLSYELLPA